MAVLGIERVLCVAFTAVARTSSADSRRAERLIRRLNGTTLPLAADYVRLMRSLALVFAYETYPPLVTEPSQK
jgi:hypothetical protein